MNSSCHCLFTDALIRWATPPGLNRASNGPNNESQCRVFCLASAASTPAPVLVTLDNFLGPNFWIRLDQKMSQFFFFEIQTWKRSNAKLCCCCCCCCCCLKNRPNQFCLLSITVKVFALGFLFVPRKTRGNKLSKQWHFGAAVAVLWFARDLEVVGSIPVSTNLFFC